MTETRVIDPPRHFYRGAAPDRHQARRAAVVTALSSGLSGRALDYGAGWGDLTARLAPQFDHIEGVDVEADRAAFAAREYAPIHFAQCAAEGLAYPDASFDVVFSIVVIQFVPSAATYIAECRRVLKPGGTLVIMIQNPESMYRLLRRLRRRDDVLRPWGGWGKLEDFKRWLPTQGFGIEAQNGFYDPPFDRLRSVGDIAVSAMNAVGHVLQIEGHRSYVGFRCRSIP